uniref:Dpy-19 like 2 n=1 Tax=Pipistrellus kuhlii TaxID=59472 RepID=A0A7J7WL43_PIPKU|nr:dpy-19 like 2 [Pipistrellus kuhlii]
MPRQRRNRSKDAASKARQASPRCTRPRRRGRAAGAGEPEGERPPRAEADWPGPRRPVSGGSPPGGARPCSPRRPGKRRAQNCVRLEVPPGSLLGRFQGLGFVLEQLRHKVHLLRRRQLSLRTTVGLGVFVGIMHWDFIIPTSRPLFKHLRFWKDCGRL